MHRKIKMGMVGGGRGAFIGTVHRIAASIDNQIELVCGAFSSDPQKSRESGRDWYLPENRCYGSYKEMFAAEKQLPPGRADGFRLHRDAQFHALPGRQDGAGKRFQCHV